MKINSDLALAVGHFDKLYRFISTAPRHERQFIIILEVLMIELGIPSICRNSALFASVALNYGVFRRKSFNSTAVYYMFFDMGATSTSATVVAYQEVKNKNKVTGILEKDPQLTIKGVG